MVTQAVSGNGAKPHITVKDLTMAFGSFVLMRDLNFSVNHGDVFIIMGGSGCGKSTLSRLGEISFTAMWTSPKQNPSKGRRCSGAWGCCFRREDSGAP